MNTDESKILENILSMIAELRKNGFIKVPERQLRRHRCPRTVGQSYEKVETLDMIGFENRILETIKDNRLAKQHPEQCVSF